MVLGVVAIGAAPALGADPYKPQPFVTLKHPEWSKDATIYELNTRQFSEEGTFKAAEKELPRLKDLGVDIIWLMPIHPIGEKNRKGTLGSPYAVKDYFAVNPEFGTFDDLKAFVDAAHALGMKVILDWVANHTAWDNVIVDDHADWYVRDWKGDFRPTPWWDWSDIIDLDYEKPALRRYMTDAMKFWVREAGIDGYRCDVAGFVPVDFWNNVRRELDQIKPVFMLAEWEARDLHAKAFDASYAWSWYEAMHNIAKGKADVNALFVYYSWNESAYPREAMRMTFVTNHDKNSWEGTGPEAFGPMLPAAIALSVVGEGIPLIYSSQEAGEKKRLEFFEKDAIKWEPDPTANLYKKLFALKKANPVLWNAQWGGRMIKSPNSAPTKVFSFVRQKDGNRVFAAFNFSAEPQTVAFEESLHHGTYIDFADGSEATFGPDTALALEPWGYRVFTAK